MDENEFKIKQEDSDIGKETTASVRTFIAEKKAIFVDIKDAEKVEAYIRKLSDSCPSVEFQKICTMVTAINELQKATEGLDAFFGLNLGRSKSEMIGLREDVGKVMDQLCEIAKEYQSMTYAELDPWKSKEVEE